MAHRKHKEVIEAWLNGAQVQHKDCAGQWEDSEQDQPGFFGHMEYRIKPVEPERVYPMVLWSDEEASDVYFGCQAQNFPSYADDMRYVANAALRNACDAGQIVTREEFDRAVGDRKARDLAIAQAASDRVMASFTSHAKLPISVKEFTEIIESVK